MTSYASIVGFVSRCIWTICFLSVFVDGLSLDAAVLVVFGHLSMEFVVFVVLHFLDLTTLVVMCSLSMQLAFFVSKSFEFVAFLGFYILDV